MKLLLTAVAALAILAIPDAEGRPALSVQTTTDPSVLSPGADASLNVAVQNTGDETAIRVNFEALELPPGITVLGMEQPIGSIGPDEDATFSFVLQVDDTVPAGRHLFVIDLEYSYVEGGSTETSGTVHTVTINVQDRVELAIGRLWPTTFQRGRDAQMSILVENPSETRWEDLRIVWSANDALLPLGRDNQGEKRSLSPNQAWNYTTPVAVSPNAPSGLTSVMVTITYQDDAGTSRTLDSRIGVRIGGPAVFDVGDARLVGDDLFVPVGVIGRDIADAVVVRALQSGAVVATTLVGSLDREKPTEVRLQVEQANPDAIQIDHTDELAERHTIRVPISLRTGTPAKFDAGDARMIGETLSLTLGVVGRDGAQAVVVRATGERELGTNFLGTLDPGDYATIAIDVLPGTTAEEVQGIRIDHTDDAGERHTTMMPLAVIPEAKPVTESRSLTMPIVVGVIVVLVIATIIIRRR